MNHGAASPHRYGCRQGAVPKHHCFRTPVGVSSWPFASPSLRRGSVGFMLWVLCAAFSVHTISPRELRNPLGKRFGRTRNSPQQVGRIESEDVDPRTWSESRSTSTTGQATWCEANRRRSQPQLSPLERTGTPSHEPITPPGACPRIHSAAKPPPELLRLQELHSSYAPTVSKPPRPWDGRPYQLYRFRGYRLCYCCYGFGSVGNNTMHCSQADMFLPCDLLTILDTKLTAR